jgi:hypothetical protein
LFRWGTRLEVHDLNPLLKLVRQARRHSQASNKGHVVWLPLHDSNTINPNDKNAVIVHTGGVWRDQEQPPL